MEKKQELDFNDPKNRPEEWAEWLKLVKPCPFCRSSNLGFITLFNCAVQCRDCLAEGPGKEEMEAAIAAWNHSVR